MPQPKQEAHINAWIPTALEDKIRALQAQKDIWSKSEMIRLLLEAGLRQMEQEAQKTERRTETTEEAR